MNDKTERRREQREKIRRARSLIYRYRRAYEEGEHEMMYRLSDELVSLFGEEALPALGARFLSSQSLKAQKRGG